ncbi:MAG: ABC transporter ATP-binding protein [Trueperaceae bacterium]|nr:ABC transporter ATP-binding protein [Trueperaceae bacterium]
MFSPANILEVDSLSKRFGGLLAVSGYHVKLAKAEILGLMGPNGAGKTTVLNLLSGLDQPSSGKIQFLGQAIEGLASHVVTRLGLARTFQNLRLFPEMTVLENVMAASLIKGPYSILDAFLQTRKFHRGNRALEKKAVALLDPLGLASDLEQPAGKLPYGKQRRLEIARALATEPKLLLLDEPAAGMVQEEQQDLALLLKQLREEGLSLLVIDHNIAFLTSLCDRIQVMHHGELVAEGLPQEVVKNPVVIEAYLGEEGAL